MAESLLKEEKMKILFHGKSPQEKYYTFGVVNNHKTNDLILVLDAMQEEIDLRAFKPFIKMENQPFQFSNKDGNLIPIEDGSDKQLTFKYELTRSITQYKNIDFQLQFENYQVEDVAIWQTDLFNVTFDDTINADETIIKSTPSILSDHEKRIEVLENTPSNSTILEYPNHFSFPSVGQKNVIYIDAAENKSYRYSIEKNKYYIIGSNYEDILIINGNGGD